MPSDTRMEPQVVDLLERKGGQRDHGHTNDDRD